MQREEWHEGFIYKETKVKEEVEMFESLVTKNVPQLFVQILQALPDVKKEWIRQIGFGTMLQLTLTQIPKLMAHWIVDNFESARCGLNLQDGSCIDVTVEEVQRVLGIHTPAATLVFLAWTDESINDGERKEMTLGGFGKGKLVQREEGQQQREHQQQQNQQQSETEQHPQPQKQNQSLGFDVLQVMRDYETTGATKEATNQQMGVNDGGNKGKKTHQSVGTEEETISLGEDEVGEGCSRNDVVDAEPRVEIQAEDFIALPSFNLMSSEEVDILPQNEEVRGEAEQEEGHDLEANDEEQHPLKTSSEEKRKNKGKEKETGNDETRHRKAVEWIKSPYKKRTLNILGKLTEAQNKGFDFKGWQVEAIRNLNLVVKAIVGREMKHIDMVPVPILDGKNHYYVISFYIKNYVQANVVDEALRKNNLNRKRKSLLAVLSKPVIVQLPWVGTGDKIGSLLYAMRHLETFMGSTNET
ncbi:hypothetical protein V2J09_009623 [Rumex salicifolius]